MLLWMRLVCPQSSHHGRGGPGHRLEKAWALNYSWYPLKQRKTRWEPLYGCMCTVFSRATSSMKIYLHGRRRDLAWSIHLHQLLSRQNDQLDHLKPPLLSLPSRGGALPKLYCMHICMGRNREAGSRHVSLHGRAPPTLVTGETRVSCVPACVHTDG